MVCTTDIEPTISQLISQILTCYLLIKNAPGRRNSLVLGWSLSLSRSVDPGLPFQPALLHPGHGLKSHGFEKAGQLRVLTQADRHTQTGVTYIGPSGPTYYLEPNPLLISIRLREFFKALNPISDKISTSFQIN
jgi:hypothetical protein